MKKILFQPSTITGIATLIAALGGGVVMWTTKDVSLAAGLGAFVFGVVHIMLPDNTSAPTTLEKLITDTLTAAAQHRLMAAVPVLVADVAASMKSLQMVAPTTPTQSVVFQPASTLFPPPTPGLPMPAPMHSVQTPA